MAQRLQGNRRHGRTVLLTSLTAGIEQHHGHASGGGMGEEIRPDFGFDQCTQRGVPVFEKARDRPGVSRGAQHHSTRSFCCTCSAPVGVVDVTSTLRSGRSASSRSTKGAIAKVSPTDPAWIHTRSPERYARCRP